MAVGGQWRPVGLFDSSHWDRKATTVLCEQLDCGSAVSETTKLKNPLELVWWIRLSCVHTKSALPDCLVETAVSLESPVSHQIICSGLTTTSSDFPYFAALEFTTHFNNFSFYVDDSQPRCYNRLLKCFFFNFPTESNEN